MALPAKLLCPRAALAVSKSGFQVLHHWAGVTTVLALGGIVLDEQTRDEESDRESANDRRRREVEHNRRRGRSDRDT